MLLFPVLRVPTEIPANDWEFERAPGLAEIGAHQTVMPRGRHSQSIEMLIGTIEHIKDS